jgi:hypothetical protein
MKKFGISESSFKKYRKILEANGEVAKDRQEGKWYQVGING